MEKEAKRIVKIQVRISVILSELQLINIYKLPRRKFGNFRIKL